MRSIRQSHKWEERPIMLDGQIDPLLHAEPALYFWPPNEVLVMCVFLLQ